MLFRIVANGKPYRTHHMSRVGHEEEASSSCVQNQPKTSLKLGSSRCESSGPPSFSNHSLSGTLSEDKGRGRVGKREKKKKKKKKITTKCKKIKG